MGDPPACGLGVGLTTPHRKKQIRHEKRHKPRTWTDSLDERPKRRNKVDLLEIGLNVEDWIGLAQDRYRWRALASSVMNLRVP
jgi:hypothetical protein